MSHAACPSARSLHSLGLLPLAAGLPPWLTPYTESILLPSTAGLLLLPILVSFSRCRHPMFACVLVHPRVFAPLYQGDKTQAALSVRCVILHGMQVQGLILRGVFLLRNREIEWFYQQGADIIFPDGEALCLLQYFNTAELQSCITMVLWCFSTTVLL